MDTEESWQDSYIPENTPEISWVALTSRTQLVSGRAWILYEFIFHCRQQITYLLELASNS